MARQGVCFLFLVSGVLLTALGFFLLLWFCVAMFTHHSLLLKGSQRTLSLG